MKMTLTFIALSIAAAPVVATQMMHTEATLTPHKAAASYTPAESIYSPDLNDIIQPPSPELKQFSGCDDPLNC